MAGRRDLWLGVNSEEDDKDRVRELLKELGMVVCEEGDYFE